MPPPVPPSNRQMSYGPAEVGTAGANFQPRTRSHQVRVATGSALASSVCVMSPCRTLGAAGFRAEATARFGRRAEDCFFATLRGFVFATLRVAMGVSEMDRGG